MPSHLHRPGSRLEDLRTTLRRMGLPLVLEPRARLQGLLGRSAPALLGALTLLLGDTIVEAAARGLTPAQLEHPSEDVLVALGVGTLVSFCFPLVWWLASLVLRWCPPMVRTVVGVLTVAGLVLLPWLGPVGGGSGFAETLVLLAVVLLGSYFGVGTVTTWAFRRAARELNHLGSMVGRVLPILMLALLFSFFNAEIWQVVAQLSMGRTWAIVGVMAALGIALATLNARDEISQIIRTYDDRSGARDLRFSERVSITAMCVLISLIQVTLLGVVVFVFYVVFGVLSVSPVTATQWIGSPPETFGGVFASLPFNKPLVQVCLVLAAFSALNFIVSIGTDATYRTTFLEPALDEVRHGLDVRDEYRALRAGASPSQDLTTPHGDPSRAAHGAASPGAAAPEATPDVSPGAASGTDRAASPPPAVPGANAAGRTLGDVPGGPLA
ncbi:hypothetical protein [Kocuria rhizophila]|uniref:hypothetical protein n=1 Tax=Kocuria rhizophila TaxID=72000 RepID=UPI000F538514|nr:hypothetical protein [Kocuria rhizophila]WSQ05823.1 hypothetical protein OG312_03880 [Kocuria rhizophila]